jgi:hypothetical protein
MTSTTAAAPAPLSRDDLPRHPQRVPAAADGAALAALQAIAWEAGHEAWFTGDREKTTSFRSSGCRQSAAYRRRVVAMFVWPITPVAFRALPTP